MRQFVELVHRTFTGKSTLLAKLTSVIWALAFHVSNMGGGMTMSRALFYRRLLSQVSG